MKEPDRRKDIAIAFTFFRTNGRLDWSKSIDVRVYRYEICPYSNCLVVVGTESDEKSFSSLEEAVIYFSMQNIKLYKTRDDINMFDMTPRNNIWPVDFRKFSHVTRTLKKLKGIREKSSTAQVTHDC